MFKTYNASAGSGKTTSLVIEYLSLCLLNIEQFRHILAITFTNNATAEMKERIILYLKLFAHTPVQEYRGGEKNVYDKIAERCRKRRPELNDPVKRETFMREKSQQLLEAILYDYNNFSISTIDSFFQRIIRSFAYELHLNLNFNVEISLDELYEQAIDLLINKMSQENRELSQRIFSLIDKQMEENGRWRIEYSLTDILSEYIYKEQNYQALKALESLDRADFLKACADLKREMTQRKMQSRSRAIEAASRGDELVNLVGSETVFYQGKRGLYAWFEKVLKNFPDTSTNSYIDQGMDNGTFTKKGEDAEHYDELCTLIHTIIANKNEYIKCDKMVQTITPLMLLFDLKEIMDDIKMRDNLFYLSETNAKIYEEIKDEEAPYIYEKIGNKYRHFFIDEFQDTSQMQWINLLPLIRNALAEGGETIIFGDLKQAIYRFRGGDAELLASLSSEEEFIKQNIPTDRFEVIPLDTNHRSARNIIEFNNNCFKTLESEIPFYKETQKTSEHNTLTGFVSIHFKPKELSTDEHLSQTTLLMVEDALKRGFQYRDMAILTRNRDKSSELAQNLAAAGHPVISEDSLLLSASNEVTFIVNMLQYLSNPLDTLAKFQILSYLRQHKGSRNTFSQEIGMISDPNDASFATLLESYGIKLQRERLTTLPLFTLVKELIQLFQFSNSDAYLIRFLDTLLEFSNKQTDSISQFLTWWEQKQSSVSVVSSREDNAITVTTIHKSKGLGFPVVIIPLSKYKERVQGTLWYQPSAEESTLPYIPIKIDSGADKISCFKPYYEKEKIADRIDNINTIYVAQTRAREALYIITGEKDKGNYAKLISQYLDTIEDNLTKVNDNEYLFGDADYHHTPREREVKHSTTIEQIHTSSFTPASLLPPPYEQTEEQQQGIAVHDYLASLTHFPQTEQELADMDIAIDAKFVPKAREILHRILSDEQLKPYFKADVQALNEVTITDSQGHDHRPDRVVIKDDEVKVIDYKTGQKHDEYQKQIDEYIALLKEMGYENVRGMLVYID